MRFLRSECVRIPSLLPLLSASATIHHCEPEPMQQRSAIAVIDAVLLRGLIPLWVLAGAVFKLIERNPGLLPSQMIEWAKNNDRLDWTSPFMRLAIAVEIVAAALMIFVPRLSRTVAIAILTLFCVILINEIRAGATSCGCMGNVTIPPSVMLAIDGSMLLAAITLGIMRMRKSAPAPTAAARSGSMGVVIAAVLSVVGVTLAVAVPERTATEVVHPIDNGQGANATNNTGTTPDNGKDPTPAPPAQNVPEGAIANPNPTALPGYYMTSSPASWIGKPATDIDLIKLMRFWPEDIATGTRHIIFYSRTCDHCEMMFYDHLVYPQDLPITVVEIPYDRTRLRGSAAWEMPEADVQMLSLPIGPDWVMTPPIIITIQDGVVTCAMEGEYEDCLGVEPTHEH